MRAGIFLAYWPWFSAEEQVELAVLADELGLDSVSSDRPRVVRMLAEAVGA
jgi:hypothetical protein